MSSLRLPNIDKTLFKQLHKQLKALSIQYRVIQVVVSVLLPIVEAIFVNKITAANNVDITTTLSGTLFLIVVIHLVLAYYQLFATSPLPSLILEIDQILKDKEVLQQQIEQDQAVESELEANIGMFLASFTALKLNQIKIDNLNSSFLIKDTLEEILKPWITSRDKIFNFKMSSFYSLAVYVFDRHQNELIIQARLCDDRLSQQNRKWKPGDGHVGKCFQTNQAVFWDDTSLDNTPVITVRPEDKDYYKSVIAVPIQCHNQAVGVLIITSNEAKQFEKNIHATVVLPVLSYTVGAVLISLNAVP